MRLWLLPLFSRAPPPQLCAPSFSSAHDTLASYDAGHRAAAAAPGAEGLGGAITANSWAAEAKALPLADAVRALSSEAAERKGRVMLGICAEDASEGVAALKQWVTALELPRGVLHGMDKDGVPLDMSTFGHVYIKYNSLPTERDGAGTANLAGYGGDFRGVYLNVDLQDGQFRQYAVLPLNLFGSEEAIPSPAVPPPSPPPLA